MTPGSHRPLVPKKIVCRFVDLGVWTDLVKGYSRPCPITEENPSSGTKGNILQ